MDSSDLATEVAESFQRQALEICEPGEGFDPTAVPQSGEEYLTHMLYERKRCPVVVVCRPNAQLNEEPPVATSSLPAVEKKPLLAALLPNDQWKAIQVQDFLAHRNKIAEMRNQLNANEYANSLEPPLTTEIEEWQAFCQHQTPLLTTILRISQRSLELLLAFLSEWLDGDEDEGDEESPLTCEASSSSYRAAAATLDLSSSDQWLGSWLYAVLACLHLPLEPDVHSTLRQVARSCMRWRDQLLEHEVEKAVPYNLFIHLIATVFDQLDFAEYV